MKRRPLYAMESCSVYGRDKEDQDGESIQHSCNWPLGKLTSLLDLTSEHLRCSVYKDSDPTFEVDCAKVVMSYEGAAKNIKPGIQRAQATAPDVDLTLHYDGCVAPASASTSPSPSPRPRPRPRLRPRPRPPADPATPTSILRMAAALTSAAETAPTYSHFPSLRPASDSRAPLHLFLEQARTTASSRRPGWR